MTANRRDSNEKELINLWRACGCYVIQMDRSAGFDLIVVSPQTGTHVVEIKNPLKSWSLTPAEEACRVLVELARGKYNIVTCEKDALALIGGA